MERALDKKTADKIAVCIEQASIERQKKSANLVYEGKTKNVYALENGNYQLQFKDDVTGVGGVFDPGANQVGLTIEGMGNAGLRLTTYFFELLNKSDVKSHYVNSDIEHNTMEVLPATPFGKGLEAVCRFKAVGSFMRRYGLYAQEGQDLNAYAEITLKDDKREDPLITKDALVMLNILTGDEYDFIISQTKKIAEMVKAELAKFDCELYDIKLEFGHSEGKIILIDEISAGNMRVYKGGKLVKPLELVKMVLG
ncbi:MAG: phosphoribosylaminoimidazolesuccinocarboxamide synthase [Elusimicrobia bacterium]|nr:phosphoribosylaminoimidazolesuccinocarboxamide synthase [Elusimicrobiota bacterium]